MSSLDMFEESPVLEAGGGGSSNEAAGSPPEDEEVVEEAVGSVLTDRTNTIHIDQVRFYQRFGTVTILYGSGSGSDF
jgi:hypothetical protein